MSEKKNVEATAQNENAELLEQPKAPNKITTFLKNQKKTLITVGATAATTAAAILLLKRDRSEETYEDYEEDFEEDNE